MTVLTSSSATNPSSSNNCSETMTAHCLRTLYGIDDFEADPTSGATLGISGFAEQHADNRDLSLFIDKYAPYAKGSNFSVVAINGGSNQQNDTDRMHSGTEASMDIQYGLALSFNTPVTFYTTGGTGPLIPDLQQPYAKSSKQRLQKKRKHG